MCKLSQNTVPNVYNSLQSSFLSLPWPWPGRSLPKGNQWEWWDPQQGLLAWPWWGKSLPKGNQWESWDPGFGPNVVGLPVHLLPPYTPTPPDTPTLPTPLKSSQCLLMPPIPLLAYGYLHSLQASQYKPDTAYTPNAPLTPPNGPKHPYSP